MECKKIDWNKDLFFGFSSKITEEQKIYVDSIFANQLTIVNAKSGTGKSQPISEIVLTPNGWVRMGDLKVGDYVISQKGIPTKILSIHPQGVLDVYEVIFSDNSSTKCSIDHLWKTSTVLDRANKRDGEVKSTRDIINSITYGKDQKNNHYIPLVEPVIFNHLDVNIDPYLMGLLLGDGAMSAGSVFYYTVDDELVELIKNRLPSDTEIVLKAENSYGFRKIEKNNEKNLLQIFIEGYGLLGCNSATKFIPNDYLFNDVEIRLEVLRGLLDTDGTLDYRTGKNVSYTTVSEELCNSVVFLVQSLGGIAKVTNKIKTYTYKEEKRIGKVSYVVSIIMPPNINPFKMSRKANLFKSNEKYLPIRSIKEIKYVEKEECQCIMVEDDSHLYITKDFIVTHNTTLAVGAAKLLGKPLLYVFNPVEEGKLGFRPGTQEEKEDSYLQPLRDALLEINENPSVVIKKETIIDKKGNTWVDAKSHIFTRGINIKDKTVVLDECQNWTVDQFKKMLTRIHDSCKVIMIGHTGQIDLDERNSSGFQYAINHFKGKSYVKVCTLSHNFRGRLANDADEM